jgi:hypothetical protein
MRIEIVGDIWRIETIAAGHGIRELQRLERMYGAGRWRKLKGLARVRMDGGLAFEAEVHWYEAAGVGRRELKIKRVLGD